MIVSSLGHGYKPIQSIQTKTFCASAKKKITSISMGEHHADPAPHGLTRQYIEKFHALGIDQIRCEEQPHDSTLEERIALNELRIAANKRWLEIEAIANLRAKYVKPIFSYFPHAQFERLKKIFAELMPLSDPIDHTYRATLLYRHLQLQELSLLDKVHLKLNIPHQSIDVSKDIQSQFIQQSLTANDADLIFEQIRIDTMIHNIFSKSFPKIEKKGGIIWINHDGAHLLNLTSAIFNHFYATPLCEKYSLQILPTFCSSDYVSLSTESKLATITKSQKHITDQKILTTSIAMPLYLFNVTEIDPHTYTCKHFNSLMNEVANSHRQ